MGKEIATQVQEAQRVRQHKAKEKHTETHSKQIDNISYHNAMRLEISYREKNVKNTNTWTLNNMLLNNQGITEGIKEEIKNT